MRRLPGLTLSCVLAVACSGGDGPEMLCDLAVLQGQVRIEVGVGTEARLIEGELSFERASGTVALRRNVDGAEVVLSWVGAAGLTKTVDGLAAPARLTDEGDFALLMSVLVGRPDPGAVVREVPGGYRVETGDQWIEVQFAAAKTAGG